MPDLPRAELFGRSGPKCLHKAGVPCFTGGRLWDTDTNRPHIADEKFTSILNVPSPLCQAPSPRCPAFWIFFFPNVFTCALSAWNSPPSPSWFLTQVSSSLSCPQGSHYYQWCAAFSCVLSQWQLFHQNNTFTQEPFNVGKRAPLALPPLLPGPSQPASSCSAFVKQV